MNKLGKGILLGLVFASLINIAGCGDDPEKEKAKKAADDKEMMENYAKDMKKHFTNYQNAEKADELTTVFNNVFSDNDWSYLYSGVALTQPDTLQVLVKDDVWKTQSKAQKEAFIHTCYNTWAMTCKARNIELKDGFEINIRSKADHSIMLAKWGSIGGAQIKQ